MVKVRTKTYVQYNIYNKLTVQLKKQQKKKALFTGDKFNFSTAVVEFIWHFLRERDQKYVFFNNKEIN